MNHCILPLFPSPIYCTQIDVTTAPGWDTIAWEHFDTRDCSESNYLLDSVEWKTIRSQIIAQVENYFFNELKASKAISINITTSFVNRNDDTQVHYRHSHRNSVLSGCLYFSSHPRGIRFTKPGYQQLYWDKSEHNLYNSDDWVIYPETGLLLIWPSNLEHEVEPLQVGDQVRYSLAFNTWITGTLSERPNMPLAI